MAVQHFGVGDLVRVHDLVGTWTIDRISSGRALLRRTDDDRDLSRLVSDLWLVRAASGSAPSTVDPAGPEDGEEPLF